MQKEWNESNHFYEWGFRPTRYQPSRHDENHAAGESPATFQACPDWVVYIGNGFWNGCGGGVKHQGQAEKGTSKIKYPFRGTFASIYSKGVLRCEHKLGQRLLHPDYGLGGRPGYG